MADESGIDLINRDPNEINNHLQVEFQDILAEPEAIRSIDCVWSTSYTLFNCGKSCCYKFLTTLCGIFIALGWGCEFAVISFEQIWCNTPMLRVFSIYAMCVQKYFGTCMNCCLAPICEGCALCFSKITVVNKSG